MYLGENYQSGGAGLISCPDDYILFIDAMCSGGVGRNGARILSRATIDLMRMSQLKGDSLRYFSGNALAGYGYGLGVRTMIDKAAGGSNGSLGEFGWSLSLIHI